MGQTIIDEETKIESQTWSAPANFELPTQFEDILTDELTDEKDTELINNQKDTDLIQQKEQSNYVPPTPGEYLATHPLKPGADFLGNVVKDTAQHAYNSLLDNLLQPNTLLGGEQLDPDNYSPETHPQYYDKKFVTDKDGNLVPIEGIEVGDTTDLKKELNPQTSTIYQTEFIGPIRPTVGIDGKLNRNLISIAGKNGILGEWGKARTANKDGVWEDYNFLFSDQPLDYDEGMLSKMTSWLLVYGLISRGGKGSKLDFMGWKRPRALTKLGKQVGGLKGLKLNLRGRGYRALTEGQATSILVNEVLGTPGDTGFGGFVSDAVVSMGDQAGIDVRSPITDFLGSENTANDPYHVAKLKNRLAELFVENQVGGAIPEGIGLGKNQLLKAPALAKSFSRGFNTQLEKVTDFAADLIVQQKAVSDLEKAVVLAKDGPTEIKTEVVPTERITGSKNTEPSGKKIEPKATQEELDIQVKEAEAEVVKAEENVEKSVETLGQRDGLIKNALQGELKKVAQSDARALKETDAVLKQTRKGRKKIEPGTPHKEKEGIVRGYEGRWVTKKHFDKVTESKKGGNEIRRQFGLPEERTAAPVETKEQLVAELNALGKEPPLPPENQRFVEGSEVEGGGSKEFPLRRRTMTPEWAAYRQWETKFDELNAKLDALKEESPEPSRKINADKKKLEFLDNERKKLQAKATDLLSTERTTKPTVEEAKTLIKDIDNYLDESDKEIFSLVENSLDRNNLEIDYKRIDNFRRQVKNTLKELESRLTNEIGTKPETVESPLTERPFFDFDIKGAKTSYRQMTVEFESDIDRAIYIVTKRRPGRGPARERPLYIEQSNKDASRANHKYLAFLYENGLDDKDILKHAPKIYNKMADNYSANSVYDLKDTGAWKDGSDFDFEIDESELYNPERKLGDIIKDVDDKLTDEYKARTSPKDPGDLLDPDISYEAPELPSLPRKGNKGKAYERILLTEEQLQTNIAFGFSAEKWNQIFDTIRLIAGEDTKIRLEHELISVHSRKSALEYGRPELEGQPVYGRGAYNEKRDLLLLAMVHKDNYIEFSRAIKTAFHESFHRLQSKFLTEAELKLLDEAAPKLRELVKKAFPEMSEANINKLGNRELQAWAFAAWSDPAIKSQHKATWMQPLRKIAEIIDAALSIFRSEYKTWDELFDAAAKGEIAQRQALEAQANARRMSYEIDPDELVSGMGKYQEGIENGDITLDTAMESETRRLISRSGQTDFVSRDNTALIAMNATMEDAIRGAFGSREEVTNMPAYQLREVWNKASKQVEADGFDPAKTIELYEHARKGDIQSMDDIFAAAGILYHRDLNLKLMTEAAIGFNGADTDKGAALFGKKLLARMEDQIKLDIAWTSVTRKTGQILRLAATPHEEVLASSLASGVELKMTTSKEAATAATSGGFVPQQGLIGEGVYFSTSSTPGPIGSVELYGTTPEDILILDLVSTNKRITDLINELGLGVTKKTKDGIQLTPQQQEGIKGWAAEQGYGGIRYGTDFTLNPKTGDQVVVFDVNTANRMIDSDAAVPPPKKEAPPIRTLLQTALQKTEEVLGKKLPRKVRKSIESGNLTPEAKKILDTLAAITYSIKDDAGAKRAMSDLIERVPDGQLNSSTIANLYRNSIFFRMRTAMKVLFGSGYRAATLPITQLVGEFGDQLNMSDAQIKLSQRRQHLNLMIYPQYMRNIPYALRMMVAAMKHNEVFVNLGRRKYENLSTRSFKERQDQLEFDFEAKTRLTEQPPEGHFMLDEHANPIAQGIWQIASTLSGRALGGFDTFMAGVTGPSTEWARIMEMELFNADVKGFEPGSSKAWDWAANRTDEILKSHFQDVDLANGDIIKNGRLTGKHAKKAMDWVNFTDSVKVKQEEISYEYAVRQAREEGITDPLKIVERADFLMKEELDQGSQFRQAVEGTLNFIPDAVSKGHGSDNPFIANTVGIAIPIMRTPANLTKSVIRTLPGPNRYVDSFWRDIHSEDPFTKSRALGESGVAIMTLSFGVMLVNSGYVEVTGPPPLSTARRKELADKGWQSWSIRFKNPWAGDTEDEWSPYYSIEMFDQLATVLGAVGTYTENYKGLRDEDRASLFGAGMIALRQTAQEIGIGQLIKGPTKSLTDLMDLITELGSTERTKAGSRHPFEYYLTQKLASFWPGFSDESRNAVDPYVKRINPSKLPIPLNVVENVAKTIAAKSAGLSDLIPNRLHPVTGDPIVSYQTPGNQGIDKDMPWLKMLNANMPWGVTKTRSLSTDPVDEEMLRVKGRGGTFQIWNRRAFGLPNRVLDQNELNRLIEIGTKEIRIDGLTMHEALKSKLTSPTYQSLDYESVSSSISTSRGISLMKTIKPYVDKAKDAFIIEYDTGVGSLGWEIKNFKSESERRQYEAEYGKQSSIQDWKQLAQA
mgnify:CR=1 FL=1|tara:strand:+ start:1954 stop:9153 length:7200 start_codon:yes stop_codon:yes gene_type:complete